MGVKGGESRKEMMMDGKHAHLEQKLRERDPATYRVVAVEPDDVEAVESLARCHTSANLLRAALLALHAEGRYGSASCSSVFGDGTEGVAILELEGRADRQIWEKEVRLLLNSWTIAGGLNEAAATPEIQAGITHPLHLIALTLEECQAIWQAVQRLSSGLPVAKGEQSEALRRIFEAVDPDCQRRREPKGERHE
jgi:hypothetical protein